MEKMTNLNKESIQSYVGMVIHSTTLDTEAKVKAIYGGSTWIQHSGYMLRGATSGVVANSATKTGGSDDAIVVAHNHGIPYQVNNAAGTAHWGPTMVASATGYTDSKTVGESGTNKNIPNYKSVYIWERTA